MVEIKREVETADQECARAVHSVEFSLLSGLCDREPPSVDDGDRGEGHRALQPVRGGGCDHPLLLQLCVLVSASVNPSDSLTILI